MDDALPTATFRVPDDTDGDLDPRPIIAELVASMLEFQDLRSGEALVMVVFRNFEKSKGGKTIIGEMHVPRFTGSMSLGAFGGWMLAMICGGTPPDYLMVLDHGWWRQATPTQREALVFHELMHAMHAVDKHGELRFDPEGKPVWDIRAHDISEFNAVAARYGAVFPDIAAFRDILRRTDNL